ncbi:MAG: hypothetical protein U0L51_08100 [Olegusella sp.]|nr:hypothetical protein [Olegusella sp.]
MPTRSASTRPNGAIKASRAAAREAGKTNRAAAKAAAAKVTTVLRAGKKDGATAKGAAMGATPATAVAAPRAEKPHARVSTPRAEHPHARASAHEQEARRRERGMAARGREAVGRDQEARRRERRQERAATHVSPAEAIGSVMGFFAESRGRRILGGVLITIALLVAALYGPAKSYYTAVRERDDLTTYYARLEASNSSLRDSIQYLQSTEGIEDEARKRGYVYEGETSAQIDGLEDTTDDFTGTSEVPDVEQPWYVQALDRFFGYQSPAY